MTGLPGVRLPVVSPDPGPARGPYGEIPSLSHMFQRYDDYGQIVYTAEQVVNDVENRCHSRVDPLPVILLRKGIITGEEFLEAVHARDFTIVG